MSMDNYSKAVEETKMVPNVQKEQMHIIGLERVKTATYNRSVADIRLEEAEPNRVWFTVGGDILQYTGKTSTEIASIETAKLLINSTLSTKGAKFMAMDILNFYIHNDFKDYQYMQFAMNEIPQEIIDEYNLKTIVHEDG